MTLYTQIIEHIYGRNTFYPQLLEKTEKSLLEYYFNSDSSAQATPGTEPTSAAKGEHN